MDVTAKSDASQAGPMGEPPAAPATPESTAEAEPVLSPAIGRIAAALGLPALDESFARALLATAGDVAHKTERRNAPLATFLLGRWVGSGGDPAEGMRRILGPLDEPGDVAG